MTGLIDVQLNILSKKAPMLNKLKDKMKRKIEETNLNDTIKFDLNTRLESMPKHNMICHGDFNPSNVIIKNDGTVWTQNELDSYIGSLNNSPDILAADTEGLIINDAKNRKEAEQLNVLLDSIKNSQLGAMKDYANSLGQDVTGIDRNYLMALLRQLNR